MSATVLVEGLGTALCILSVRPSLSWGKGVDIGLLVCETI
jgi:hypothetical protein